MLALYRAERQAEALEVYQRVRAHLEEALGLQPGHALQALHVQILRHSVELDQPSTSSRDRPKSLGGDNPAEQDRRESRRTPVSGYLGRLPAS
jgi:DNA-binding SARP family transcriptional activator